MFKEVLPRKVLFPLKEVFCSCLETIWTPRDAFERPESFGVFIGGLIGRPFEEDNFMVPSGSKYLLRRGLTPKNHPKAPSKEVFGPLGVDCFC